MSTIAKIDGIAIASIANIDNITKASIAKIDGIAIASKANIDNITKASIAKIDGVDIVTVTWFSPTAIHSKCGEDYSHPATNTIDSNMGTEWIHNVSHEHWIIFDLGSTKTVTKIRVYAGSPIGYGELCGVSAIYINNTADESGGSKGSGATSAGWTEIDVVNTSGRYIKLKLQTYGSGSCSNTHYLDHFYEFEATNE